MTILVQGAPVSAESTLNLLQPKCSDPTANFTYTNTFGSVIFTDFSSYAVTWYWDFGDGTTDTLQHPIHSYSTPGTYNVCLTVLSYCGLSDSKCTTVIISCPDDPVALFTQNTSFYTSSFFDLSSYASTWLWDFGDGITSTEHSPTHTYGMNGTYSVCLIASNPCSSDVICETITISCTSPNADFNYSEAMLDVNFTDLSSNPSEWYWDFGDGSIDSLKNPAHSFPESGIYNVCLTTVADAQPFLFKKNHFF